MKRFLIEFSDLNETNQIVTVRSYHVTYTFQSESTLYSCLNVKELLAWKRRDIWPVWLNSWVFVYGLSGCGFKSIKAKSVYRKLLNLKLFRSSLALNLYLTFVKVWKRLKRVITKNEFTQANHEKIFGKNREINRNCVGRKNLWYLSNSSAT